MFARKATFRAKDRVHGRAQVKLIRSNDMHRTAGAPQAPGLVCHWHIAPATGKPECHWQSERAMPEWFDGERTPRLSRFDPAR
jgi:hypothetical protein